MMDEVKITANPNYARVSQASFVMGVVNKAKITMLGLTVRKFIAEAGDCRVEGMIERLSSESLEEL